MGLKQFVPHQDDECHTKQRAIDIAKEHEQHIPDGGEAQRYVPH